MHCQNCRFVTYLPLTTSAFYCCASDSIFLTRSSEMTELQRGRVLETSAMSYFTHSGYNYLAFAVNNSAIYVVKYRNLKVEKFCNLDFASCGITSVDELTFVGRTNLVALCVWDFHYRKVGMEAVDVFTASGMSTGRETAGEQNLLKQTGRNWAFNSSEEDWEENSEEQQDQRNHRNHLRETIPSRQNV